MRKEYLAEARQDLTQETQIGGKSILIKLAKTAFQLKMAYDFLTLFLTIILQESLKSCSIECATSWTAKMLFIGQFPMMKPH